MKKKLLSMVLIACMVFSYTACGDTGNDSSETDSKTNQSSSSIADSSSDESENKLQKFKENVDSVKEIVNGAKEIVSDAKEIKDALQGDKITVPIKSKKCKGENYEKIVEEFEDAGFTDVKAKGNGKLKVGLLHDEGDVESVSINGDDSFDKGDKYASDAKIVITYYSKK